MNELARYAFIPADYRQPVVLGWKGPDGFFPDEPLRSREGFLVRVGSRPGRRR